MIQNINIKISGMHCVSCAMNIDGELEDLVGVLESRTNYIKQVTEVKFDDQKVGKDSIIDTILKTGYEVVSK